MRVDKGTTAALRIAALSDSRHRRAACMYITTRILVGRRPAVAVDRGRGRRPGRARQRRHRRHRGQRQQPHCRHVGDRPVRRVHVVRLQPRARRHQRRRRRVPPRPRHRRRRRLRRARAVSTVRVSRARACRGTAPAAAGDDPRRPLRGVHVVRVELVRPRPAAAAGLRGAPLGPHDRRHRAGQPDHGRPAAPGVCSVDPRSPTMATVVFFYGGSLRAEEDAATRHRLSPGHRRRHADAGQHALPPGGVPFVARNASLSIAGDGATSPMPSRRATPGGRQAVPPCPSSTRRRARCARPRRRSRGCRATGVRRVRRARRGSVRAGGPRPPAERRSAPPWLGFASTSPRRRCRRRAATSCRRASRLQVRLAAVRVQATFGVRRGRHAIVYRGRLPAMRRSGRPRRQLADAAGWRCRRSQRSLGSVLFGLAGRAAPAISAPTAIRTSTASPTPRSSPRARTRAVPRPATWPRARRDFFATGSHRQPAEPRRRRGAPRAGRRRQGRPEGCIVPGRGRDARFAGAGPRHGVVRGRRREQRNRSSSIG